MTGEAGTADGRGRRRPWLDLGGEAILRLAGRLRRGELELVLADGRYAVVRGAEPGPRGTLKLARGRVLRRYLVDGAVGFAESYIDGDWDSPDLATLFELLERNSDAWGAGYYGSLASRWLRRLRHRRRANTRRGAERNIAAHYDLGNAFFAAWLDPTMLYSSARFLGGAESLEAAQIAKCRRLAELIDLRPGHRLLEIGSGWGGFALMAAREHGAQVTSITISREQQALAQRRVHEAGLAERVEIRLCDYRDVTGTFDRIASIEMVEAVGEPFWPVYFATLRDRLAPGGIAGLQAITIADRWFEAYRRTPDFIQLYVFPGGMLMSPATFAREAARAGLHVRARECFAADYARTLALWLDRFEAAWPSIAPLGFDQRFRRIWTYYLAYCAAGFRTGATDVSQTALARP
jgi:cyclopropane-fatty-acyl-phospholipid synthase